MVVGQWNGNKLRSRRKIGKIDLIHLAESRGENFNMYPRRVVPQGERNRHRRPRRRIRERNGRGDGRTLTEGRRGGGGQNHGRSRRQGKGFRWARGRG